ncbi:MAG TPA: VOC family protein [Burkholderiales bacterium]|nr:VOC family protein [Burkholderiales bacterium]
MQRITPFLWFDRQAEEAAKFYCSIFKKSKILAITRHLEGGGVAPGEVLTVQFRLGDQEYVALNGGPQFKFTEAISLMIHCKDQKEVDYYWEKLLAGGGQESACGWLKDKYGLSWQVTPAILLEMISDKNRKKAQRAFDAMLQMRKIEIRKLKEAYGG